MLQQACRVCDVGDDELLQPLHIARVSCGDRVTYAVGVPHRERNNGEGLLRAGDRMSMTASTTASSSTCVDLLPVA